MKIARILAVLFGLLLLVSGLTAQSFFTRTFEENNGLINSAVNDIAQDPAGWMWFAGRDGISVYDGAAWFSYTNANALAARSVYKIRADGRGSMWAIGSDPAWVLMRFDGRTWTSFPIPQIEGPPFGCTALAVRSESGRIRVAVGTALSGVFLFDGIGWKVFSKAQGLAGNEVRDIVVFEEGFLAATSEGLSWIGENSIENRWEKDDPRLREDIRGTAVETGPNGEKIWVLGTNWLGTIRKGRLELLNREILLRFTSFFPAAVLLPDRKGGLIYGHASGLFYHDGASGSIYPLGVREGLIAEGATSLLLDRESIIWIGGLRGVSRISSRRFFNYGKAQGLLDDEVTAIQSFSDGAIAFGHNLGLSLWDGKEFRQVRLDLKRNIVVADVRILDMVSDDAGGLWLAASAQGLGRMSRDGRLRWYDFSDGPDQPVTSVVYDRNRQLWISRNNSLFQLKNGRPVEVFPGMFQHDYIRKLVAGPDGSIFVATGNRGLFRWDGKAWTHFFNETDSGATSVFSVRVDAHGRTLVGTLFGLYQIIGNRLDRFSENGFEIRRPIYLILEDKPGRLWFGTDNGLIRWDGRKRLDFLKDEGLAGREINRSAGLIDQSGRIWFGTNSGASCYREEFDDGPEEVPPPTVSILNLEINGKPADASTDLVLGYRDNNLVFRFSGTSFINENALRFQSRLDGFDKIWSPEYASFDREIRYTNLPPGKYVFNLRAKNSLGKWSKPVSSRLFEIRNPFWLQWWFILTVILLVGGVIVSLNLAITEYRQSIRLEALVKERTAQIQASLNEKEILLKEIHHRVKNNLQIVSSLLFLQSRRIMDPGMLDLFQGSISRIRAMALVHESLYRSDQMTSIMMENYLRELIHRLLDTYSLRKVPVTASVRASGISLPLETAIPFGLIVNELVSNAFKHAFPDDRKGHIDITLARSDGEKKGLVLTVSDNGVGIPEEMEGGKADSLGLRLVQNLAAQLEGTIEIRRDRGTIFRIFFPNGLVPARS